MNYPEKPPERYWASRLIAFVFTGCLHPHRFIHYTVIVASGHR